MIPDKKTIAAKLRTLVKGEVIDDPALVKPYARDASIFEIQPLVAVFPKTADDVAAVVRFVHDAKASGEFLSVTARAAGTDMTGGPLTSSVVMVFTKFMNHIREIGTDYAITEMGVYYRDFERETLKRNLLLPSYPASRSIAAMGGIVNNNSGGERTLEYGKTEHYVEEVAVVLSNGDQVRFGPLTSEELEKKKLLQNFEGAIYRSMHDLLRTHAAEIEEAKPTVSKNSAGYALWNIVDKQTDICNLAKLIVGAQGTLGIVTEAKIKLIKPQGHRAMLVIFLNGISELPEIVKRVLSFGPESFESYDDHTYSLALRFLPEILRGLGVWKAIRLGISFIPEFLLSLTGGIPKLILTAEFSEDTAAEARQKVKAAAASLKGLSVRTKLAQNERAAEKYWIVRRESFNLLRKNLHGFIASPFIDDFVVRPEDLPTFLPELNALLAKYHLIYTVAGHVGNGNFHIIPLMNLSDPHSRAIITELSKSVYELVARYHGSTTGEHNDGIIRTPYLPLMFSESVLGLFAQTKKIFDPLNILNPGKKVGGTLADIEKYMVTPKESVS